MPRGAILAEPQHRAGAAATQRQQQCKGSDACCIAFRLRIKFVERRDLEAAAEPRIDSIEPERQARAGRRNRRRGQARKGRQRGGATRHVHYLF
jgi:hypothetical protein